MIMKFESAALPAICTDRPTKSNYACTVEPGHFQYEADITNYAAINANGATAQTWIVLNPTFKYGLTPQIDIAANFSPFVSVHSHDQSGAHATLIGVSDLYLRMKYEFANIDRGAFQATFLPYIKTPTARLGIGNGAVEAGLILPVNYKLGAKGACGLRVSIANRIDRGPAPCGLHVRFEEAFGGTQCW